MNMSRKNKLSIILIGMLIISIVHIILVLVLDCSKFGVYIAYADVISIFLWLLVSFSILKPFKN